MSDANFLDRPLTGLISKGGDLACADYERNGGYRAVREMIATMSPDAVVARVTESDLRGRGGAGFPTGKKWSLVPRGGGSPRPKYLIVNADEMEPGTFKDRYLLERNPHQVIEGAIIASFAIEAEIAIIFLRWEYTVAAKRLRQSIAEAYAAGYLGPNIRGSKFTLKMHVHVSAGRYICGEETALLNAMEGKRAIPRNKPPFPVVAGLFGKPTVVNNTETVCNLPHILNNGASWFRGLGTAQDSGTKMYGVSGRVKRPGLFELPMGSTVGEILGRAGGMIDGYTLRGFQPGGASTDFLVPQPADLPMDFGSIQKAGSRLGTGNIIVLDHKTCPVGMVRNLIAFFARESCGWCTPCRDGLPWAEWLLDAIESGTGRTEDLASLEHICFMAWIGKTFCALAPGAIEPLRSALRLFREDFERHIAEKKCPYRVGL